MNTLSSNDESLQSMDLNNRGGLMACQAGFERTTQNLETFKWAKAIS